MRSSIQKTWEPSSCEGCSLSVALRGARVALNSPQRVAQRARLAFGSTSSESATRTF